MFKPIPGFEGLYEINECGHIRGIKRNCLRKLNQDKKTGYLSCNLKKYPNEKRVRPHRLVALLFIENPLNLPEVNHIDGDKTNNHVSNLEWCTRSHNQKHAWDLGLHPVRKTTNTTKYNWYNKFTGEREYLAPYELKRKYNLPGKCPLWFAVRYPGKRFCKGWGIDTSEL